MEMEAQIEKLERSQHLLDEAHRLPEKDLSESAVSGLFAICSAVILALHKLANAKQVPKIFTSVGILKA